MKSYSYRQWLMKSMMNVILTTMLVSLPGCATTGTGEASSPSFKISKVNQLSRRLTLLGKGFYTTSTGDIEEYYDTAPQVPEEEQGEEYVVEWKYSSGKIFDWSPLPLPVMLRFEYRYRADASVLVDEQIYEQVKPGTHVYRFRNLGEQFESHGPLDCWKVTILYDNQVVATKKCGLWLDI